MDYWKVEWKHDFQEEPTTFYSEIGEDGYEVRKVQRFRDGRLVKADAQHESGEVGLSEIPVGRIEDVKAQPDFSAFTISFDEFQVVWLKARWGRSAL
ncbi:hypothetical protein E4198_15925 [Streptomyces sp. RKND-216]|uniref:DUF6881 domain-containing protein n=1 Tax=Streptomyces sp. RKND-216 TaxID=2562581 RepID=UPI00109DD6CA|nr:hypothetical protein [Streptomyces sp. RKND-216]THA25988.1 hypothetical protein E4198_15925 [Streptomyces sp. RKND-216]